MCVCVGAQPSPPADATQKPTSFTVTVDRVVVTAGEFSFDGWSAQMIAIDGSYHWDAANKNFLCPCHTSTFSVEGKVLSGPAPRALDRYTVKIDGGKILIGPVVKSV